MGGALVTALQTYSDHTVRPHAAAQRARDPSNRIHSAAFTSASVFGLRHGIGDEGYASDHTAVGGETPTNEATDVQMLRACYRYRLPGHAYPYNSAGQGSVMTRRGAAAVSANNDDGGCDAEMDDMGTMDCADASTYFHGPEELYVGVESALYRAPLVAQHTTAALRALYARGVGAGSATEWVMEEAPPIPEEEDGVPDSTSGEVPFAGYVSATSKITARRQSSSPPLMHRQRSPSGVAALPALTFTSLVQELKGRCVGTTLADASAASWRRANCVTAQTGSNAGATVGNGTAAARVYHMGPRQYLTYGSLWGKVESFAEGLRAIGLVPGDLLLLLEDTRVEWLITCYAAWACGLVVAASPDTEWCLTRVTLEADGDLKAVVCHSGVVQRLRRHLAAAVSSRVDDDQPASARVAAPTPVFITTRRLLVYGSDGQDGEADSASADDMCLRWGDVLEVGESRPSSHNRGEMDEDGMAPRAAPSSPSTPSSISPAATSTAAPHSTHAALPSSSLPLPPGGLQGTSTPRSSPASTSAPPSAVALTPLRGSDLALVCYTAGEPRGVLLTHAALRASVIAYGERFDQMQLTAPPPPSETTSSGMATAGGQGRWRRLVSYTQRAVHWLAGLRLRPLVTLTGPERVLDSASQQPSRRPGVGRHGQLRYLAYLPLHRVQELVLETTMLLRGAELCFGSPGTLFDTAAHSRGDLREFRPVVLPAVPQLLSDVCARLQQQQQLVPSGLSRLLLDVSYEGRRQALRRGLDTPFLNHFAFARGREMLGGRCALVLSCAAPLHPRVQECVQVMCGAAVVQTYSLTEAAGCGAMQGFWAVNWVDNVGGPLGPVEVKLRDVAGSDWGHCNARPSGELLIRGAPVMAGYYRQPEATAEALERGGWLHTGDVAERRPDGSFRIVGRLKLNAKNARGAYIPLEALERVYASHELAVPGGVCVLVHPHRSYICALVLTDESRANAFAERHHPLVLAEAGRGRWPYYLREALFNEAATASLMALEAAQGLPAHEQLLRVRVLYDTWTTSNGMRTPTGKLHRGRLVMKYASLIDELFEEETEEGRSNTAWRPL